MKGKEIIYKENIERINVLNKKVFIKLMISGFADDFLGTVPNRNNSRFSVFIFRNSKEIVDAINEAISQL